MFSCAYWKARSGLPVNVNWTFFARCYGWIVRTKRDRKSAISLRRGHFDQKISGTRGRPQQSFLHGQLGQWMPYSVFADSFHTKKLCSRLSSSKVRFFLLKSAVLRFWDPILGDLGATYDDHLTLIGKRVVDFLLALIELFP